MRNLTHKRVFFAITTIYYASNSLLSLGTSFLYILLISVALSLSSLRYYDACLLRNITPGGSDAREIGINTMWNELHTRT